MSDDALNRFDRIVAMFIHLQSSRVVKAQDLADRFDVSLRTVYRDIRSLEAAGVPIAGEAGIGYSIIEGYRLPPVMFTREEASSFIAAEKLMQKFTDKKLGSHFESAMYKIKSVLRGHAKDHVAALESQIWINTTQQLFNENTPDALEVLIESIAEKKQVRLVYRTYEGEDAIERMIEPAGLFHEHNFWYVIGYCHLRKDYRQFRTDRMLEINRTSLPFTGEPIDVDEFRNLEDTSEKTKVVIRVKKDVIRYMRSGRKYYGFVSEVEKDGLVEMTFMARNLAYGLARWYLMFGDCAEIVEPENFKTLVKEMVEKTRVNLSGS
ncbi:MAG TPA: YafY family protein [Saprospiraceae bacterium]|nr:YafY family protein [Saprospiraceae bacterium]